MGKNIVKSMKKIAIFASGSGTNAENITTYFKGNSEVEISLIICNKPEAYVLERARQLGIPSEVIAGADMKDEAKVMQILRNFNIDFIVLAGYLVRIPSYQIRDFLI